MIISSGIFAFSLKMCLLVHRNHKNHNHSWVQVDMLRSLEQNVFWSNSTDVLIWSKFPQFLQKTFTSVWREHLWWCQVVFLLFNQHSSPSNLILMHEEMRRLQLTAATNPIIHQTHLSCPDKVQLADLPMDWEELTIKECIVFVYFVSLEAASRTVPTHSSWTLFEQRPDAARLWSQAPWRKSESWTFIVFPFPRPQRNKQTQLFLANLTCVDDPNLTLMTHL